jgi:subtilisin family serine protease
VGAVKGKGGHPSAWGWSRDPVTNRRDHDQRAHAPHASAAEEEPASEGRLRKLRRRKLARHVKRGEGADLYKEMGAEPLWAKGYSGEGIHVAVFDTGIGNARTDIYNHVEERVCVHVHLLPL